MTHCEIFVYIGSLQIKVIMGKHNDDQNKIEDAENVTAKSIIEFSSGAYPS